MPVTIRVHLAEKRSTFSQFENLTIGAHIEAEGLELHTPEEVQRKTRELFQLARGAIQAQLLEPPPSSTSRPREEAPRPHANGGNGRRSHGRPSPEPTPKQKQFLKQLAGEKNLSAESVGEICERLVGVPLRSCNRDDLSRLIDALLEGAA